jgi:hypothetical protein
MMFILIMTSTTENAKYSSKTRKFYFSVMQTGQLSDGLVFLDHQGPRFLQAHCSVIFSDPKQLLYHQSSYPEVTKRKVVEKGWRPSPPHTHPLRTLSEVKHTNSLSILLLRV